MGKSISIEERLWSRVRKAAGDGCWEFTGMRDVSGYGRIRRTRGGQVPAHRAAWELTNGPIPDGLLVCHRCDNPPCVRPDHLFLGTARDNTQDAIKKGRFTQAGVSRPCFARGEDHHWFGVSRAGTKNGRAKLSNADVQSIRERHALGEKVSVLARELGVSWTAVKLVINGRNWSKAS